MSDQTTAKPKRALNAYERFMKSSVSWDDGAREERKYQPKVRRCLMCGHEMHSRWSGDRYHPACRDIARGLASNIEP